jgi:hypothetical protein
MDFVTPTIVQQGNNYIVQHGTDSGLFVRFETKAIQDEEASTLEGRPIFRDVDFIIINIAGDKLTVHERPVDLVGNNRVPPDNIRFPRQWEAFKAKQTQPLNGTPITEWAPISKSLAMELKGMNIHTVEALAAVSDANLKWMGARELREKASAWLEKAKQGGDVSQLVAQLEQLRIDNEALKAQISAIATEKNKRGRPPKGLNDVEDAS